MSVSISFAGCFDEDDEGAKRDPSWAALVHAEERKTGPWSLMNETLPFGCGCCCC